MGTFVVSVLKDCYNTCSYSCKFSVYAPNKEAFKQDFGHLHWNIANSLRILMFVFFIQGSLNCKSFFGESNMLLKLFSGVFKLSSLLFGSRLSVLFVI